MKHLLEKPPGLLQPVANPSNPWEEIAMDFIVELSESVENTVTWNVVDLILKQVHFVTCPKIPSAWSLGKMLVQHVYGLHRVLGCIISDQGGAVYCKILAVVHKTNRLLPGT